MTDLYNIDAECSYLGMCFTNRNCLEETVHTLEPSDIYEPLYSRAFEVMQKLYVDGVTVDLPTVLGQFKENLEKQKLLKTVENIYTESVSQCEDYRDQIIGFSKKRQLRNALRYYLDEVEDSENTYEDVLDGAEKALLDISMGKNTDSCLNNGRRVALDAIEVAYQRGELKGISTGFKSIDSVLGGLADTNLVVIGGDTGMGKTSFALSLTMNQVRAGKKALFASLEMSKAELHYKIMSMASGIQAMPMLTGRVTQTQFEKLLSLPDCPNLYVLDDAGTTIESLTVQARRLKARKELDFIVVDYIHLMSAPPSIERQGDVAKIGFITRELKKLASLLDVPVIALSQLRKNRSNTGEIVKPQIGDLLGSGSIARDANIIMFVHRDEYYLERDPLGEKPPQMKGEVWEDMKLKYDEHLERARGKAQIIIAKSRMGGIGECEIEFNQSTTEFSE